jgi:hypothetical protein
MSAKRQAPPPPPGPPRLAGVHDEALDAFQEAFNHLAALHVGVRHDTYDDGTEHRMLFSLPGAARSAIIAWEEDEDEEGVRRGGISG